jgi:hypothetical protein
MARTRTTSRPQTESKSKNDNLLPDNATHTHRMQIASQSSDRMYIVAKSKTGGDWQCSCPRWIFKRTCKHLDAMRSVLNQIDEQDRKTA